MLSSREWGDDAEILNEGRCPAAQTDPDCILYHRYLRPKSLLSVQVVRSSIRAGHQNGQIAFRSQWLDSHRQTRGILSEMYGSRRNGLRVAQLKNCSGSL